MMVAVDAPLPVPTLIGQRCTLRAFVPADAPAIQRHADDPAVAFNLFDGFPQPYSLEEAEDWCAGTNRPARFGYIWAVEHGGEAVGSFSVSPAASWMRCNAEVGYWIGRAVWGRGIASEALALVSDWAFAALPEVTRLFAPIFGRNAGSQAVARKAGYALEGAMPQSAIKNGEVIDQVTYARYRHPHTQPIATAA